MVNVKLFLLSLQIQVAAAKLTFDNVITVADQTNREIKSVSFTLKQAGKCLLSATLSLIFKTVIL